MAFSHLISRLRPSGKRASVKTDTRETGTRQQKHRCGLEQLEERTVMSTFRFAVMGDSISTNYSGTRGSAGDKSWTQLLKQADGNQIAIDNYAGNGATTGSLNSQANGVIKDIQQSGVQYVAIEIGGNDAVNQLAQLAAGNSKQFINTTVTNIENALTRVMSAGTNVHAVLALIPDVSVSPLVQFKLGFNPSATANIRSAIASANGQLKAWAASHGVAIVDINAMNAQTGHAFNLDGYQITKDFFSPDYFHPGNVQQGLFANSVMTGFGRFGANVSSLRLTDAFIAQVSGNTRSTGVSAQATTYYDVGRFVIGPSTGATTADVAAAGSSISTPQNPGYLGGPGKHPPSTLPPTLPPTRLPPTKLPPTKLPPQTVNLAQTLLQDAGVGGLEFVFANAA